MWNFERVVGGDFVSLPAYFRGQGYLVLGAGKLWHWAPGPGESWSADVRMSFDRCCWVPLMLLGFLLCRPCLSFLRHPVFSQFEE